MPPVVSEKNLGYGLRALPPDPRDFALGAFYDLPKLEELPEEYFLMPKKILDQKDSDFCTAFASVAASMDQENVELSPEFTFAMTKEIEGDFQSWGADLRTAAKSHVKIGALDIRMAPFSIKTHARDFLAHWENWPQELRDKAAVHKKQAYFSVEGPYDLFSTIMASLWKFRLELRSVFTGALWRPEWTRAPGGRIPNEELPKKGFGHAFKICGWKQIHGEPHLIAQLSNGEDQGDKGFFYFPRSIVVKEFTYGCFMFADLPKEETKETAAKKSQEFRRKKYGGWLAWLLAFIRRNWL